MKVYFESIFLLNFLLDFMILYGTKRVLKLVTSIYKIIFSSFIGSMSTFLLFINISSFYLLLLKLLFGFILVFLAFGSFNLFRNTFYFYLISIILGGSFYLIGEDKINSYFLLVVGSFLLIGIFIYEFCHYKEIIHNKYIVDIYYKKKVYHLEGFIDTGNRLCSPYRGESIILVNLKISSKKLLYVPYKALNTSGVIPCIRPDKIVIENKEITNCLIGLARDKFILEGMNCILPNKLKEELC